ncbi:coiled-coil domain-containing protein 181 isoform 1-T3 [Glossophaga mutica]
MEENKGTDSKETEEYEDDFEKDLEWLINEKEKSDVSIIEMACGNEGDLGPELAGGEPGGERSGRLSDPGRAPRDEFAPRSDFISVPSSQPLDPGSDSDSENSFQESRLDGQKDLEEDEDEEVKRYIMEKIVQANKLLQKQEPVNDKRERKLKFKDKLVDLEVPPLEDTDNYKYYFESESHVSGKLSQLRISSESGQDSVLLSVTGGSCEESKDRKILVERDGKFELLNLQDIESQGCLSPIPKVSSTEDGPQQPSPRSSNSPVDGVKKEEPVAKTHGSPAEGPWAAIPQPPPNPRTGPSSAAHSDSHKGSGKPTHRTQSANVSPATSTYCLSPRQKELQKRLEQKREKLRKEAEQRKIEEEKEKKKENDTVFRAWLQKKREQVVEMRRVQRAKQLEAGNSRVAEEEADRKAGGAASRQGEGQTAPPGSQARPAAAEPAVQRGRGPGLPLRRLLRLKVSIKCSTLKPLASEFWISLLYRPRALVVLSIMEMVRTFGDVDSDLPFFKKNRTK